MKFFILFLSLNSLAFFHGAPLGDVVDQSFCKGKDIESHFVQDLKIGKNGMIYCDTSHGCKIKESFINEQYPKESRFDATNNGDFTYYLNDRIKLRVCSLQKFSLLKSNRMTLIFEIEAERENGDSIYLPMKLKTAYDNILILEQLIGDRSKSYYRKESLRKSSYYSHYLKKGVLKKYLQNTKASKVYSILFK